MENKNVWLRTSLFADRSQWAVVLNNGIKFFVEQPLTTPLIEAVLIEFNYVSGENIRFAINVQAQDAESLSHRMDAFFKSFFLKANLPKKEVVLPIDGLFLPFQSNTIRYGLYGSDLPTVEDAITKMISKTTTSIIEALAEDVVDEEILTMLGFYFYCALLTQVKETTGQDFTKICDPEESTININNESKITDDFLLERYEENKLSLMEVEESVRNYKQAEHYDNPAWLIDWMMTCKEVIDEQFAENENIVVYISNCIKRQLGLTNGMAKLVHYFVKNVYTESQPV